MTQHLLNLHKVAIQGQKNRFFLIACHLCELQEFTRAYGKIGYA